MALLSPFIQREVLRCGHGLAQADPVVLPKQVFRALRQALLLVLRQDSLIGETHQMYLQVNPNVLNLLLDYCRFHRAPGRSDKVGCFLLRIPGRFTTVL